MNKLRKPRPSSEPAAMTPNGKATDNTAASRTMQLAVAGMKVHGTTVERPSNTFEDLQRRGTWFSAPLAGVPRTKVEQYWAARALVAETLLSARDRHQDELAAMRRTEEEKREREIGAILRANDEKQRRLERVMVTCLLVLLGFMCWLVVMIAPDRGAKHRPNNQPSRFTIPILSPFASVVEHETGVFGAKAVAIFVVVMGVACYAALRYRLLQWRM